MTSNTEPTLSNTSPLAALEKLSGIPEARLRELQSGTSTPTLEETAKLTRGLLDLNLHDLYDLAGIPSVVAE